MMLDYSLVHGGSAPSFLCPFLYDVIVGGIDSATPTIDHVPNPEFKEQITKLSHAEDTSTVPEAEELILLAGCGSMMHRADRKEEMITALIHSLVLGRVSHCIDQFCHGLETLCVLKAMRRTKHSMKELFVYEEYSVDASIFELIYTPVCSEEGSNRHSQEKAVNSNWRDVLLDIEEGLQDVSLKHVLIFSTGADRAPPPRLRPQPTLTFHQCDPLSAESKQTFPFSNTCSNTLSLPLIGDYDMFKRNMKHCSYESTPLYYGVQMQLHGTVVIARPAWGIMTLCTHYKPIRIYHYYVGITFTFLWHLCLD
ncbi:G2/M phase-specific E3 ubiquitin-protein ligase-like [Haliotis asinina]|uniref:G2/M phase-specific E3 ubiquitin-protein ligase-like n=1 Tax=Haliotis asinina TaxID=109174 RepID=UPI003531F78D